MKERESEDGNEKVENLKKRRDRLKVVTNERKRK